MRLREIEKKVKELQEIVKRPVCYSMDVWWYEESRKENSFHIYVAAGREDNVELFYADTAETAFEKAFNHFKK